MVLICMAQAILILYIVLFVCYMVLQSIKKRNMSPLFWGFLFFPMSQYVAFDRIGTMEYEMLNPLAAFCAMAGFVAALLSDILMIPIIQKNKEKQALIRKLEEMAQEKALGDRRHELAEQESVEIQDMCLRYQHQLAQVQEWINNRTAEGVASLETQLQEEIQRQKRSRFCMNQIVNAVLQEKKQVCAEKQIQLKAEIYLEESCPIKGFHLCSIYSNLMDNAIHSCCQIDTGMPRCIDIRTRQVRDFLSIHIENSFDRRNGQDKKKISRPRHGYGLKILEDIVQLYEGYIEINHQGNQFQTEILLHMKEVDI